MDDWFKDKLNYNKLTLKDGMLQTSEFSRNVTAYDANSHDQLFAVEDSSYWFKHRNKIIKEGIFRNPPEHNRLVEVGGGNGNTTYYLSQHGFETSMFEPGEQGCKNALKRGVINVVCSLLNSNYAKEYSIESIGLFDVLEHIDDDGAFLTEMRDMLMDNGMLYITVPAYNLLWSESDIGHCRRYNRKTLRNVVEKSGYAVLFDTYFFCLLPVLIFIFRTLPCLAKKMGKQRASRYKQKENLSKLFIAPAFIEKPLAWLLDLELRRIIKGKRNVFGVSLFLSARKK